MKLIAGLGNPGSRYRFTRHNIGFMVVDRFSDVHGIGASQRIFGGLCGRGKIAAHPVLLVKPQEYMNRSGLCIKGFFDYFKIAVDDVIVIHDDLDLPFGTIRLKKGGGSGGHNGLISIIDHLGAAEFSRLRLGIGRPEQREMVESYVLSPFPAEAAGQLIQVIATAAEMLTETVGTGIQTAMGKYHGKNIKYFEEV